jgi:KaiC/GvpD/RAD55 family RecA-like ATPase
MRRRLTEEDLERMRIPRRFWGVSLEGCSSAVDGTKPSIRKTVELYLGQLDEMLSRGVGLLLWSDNGSGKTSAAVLVAKEARRRGATVLFVTSEGLRSAVLNKTRFDVEQTMWDRALDVDLLILDDVGKEHRDQQGFGERLLEDLIRQRSANQRTTFMTTNMSPLQMKEGEFAYKPSMLKVMQESVVPVGVAAVVNRREEVARELKVRMTG